jgi:hypothetical protein
MHTLEGRQAPQAAAIGAIRSSLSRAGGRAPPARPDQRGSAVRSRDRANSRRSAKAVAKSGSRVRSQRFVGMRHRARPGRAQRAGGAGAQGERAARAYGIPAYGLHRADLLQVLVYAASDADLRTGQRSP